MTETSWQEALAAFPPAVRDDVASVRHCAGRLLGERVSRVMATLGIDAESLMVRLLNLAKLYSQAPVSGFHVGAVARGSKTDGGGAGTLYLGANLEFAGTHLGTTVHAEQSATINAWFWGEEGLSDLAVSAVPCGHCRQFLNEAAGGPLPVLLADESGRPASQPLSRYLPNAFGPADLGMEGGLMTAPSPPPKISLKEPSEDPVVHLALDAARRSYAPYTGNYSGCALVSTGGETYLGRNMENAAYNPSVSPMESAMAGWRLAAASAEGWTVERAVLVEVRSQVHQREVSETVLASVDPKATLEYHEALAESG